MLPAQAGFKFKSKIPDFEPDPREIGPPCGIPIGVRGTEFHGASISQGMHRNWVKLSVLQRSHHHTGEGEWVQKEKF